MMTTYKNFMEGKTKGKVTRYHSLFTIHHLLFHGAVFYFYLRNKLAHQMRNDWIQMLFSPDLIPLTFSIAGSTKVSKYSGYTNVYLSKYFHPFKKKRQKEPRSITIFFIRRVGNELVGMVMHVMISWRIMLMLSSWKMHLSISRAFHKLLVSLLHNLGRQAWIFFPCEGLPSAGNWKWIVRMKTVIIITTSEDDGRRIPRDFKTFPLKLRNWGQEILIRR